MQYDIYGVGNALVDIQVQISNELLKKLNFSKGCMTLVEEATQKRVLQELDGMPMNRCAGGSAANTVMGVADFGGKAAYAGKVGNDSLGEFCLDDMRRMGVFIDVPPADGQSGSCVVLITADAERTMLTHLGVSASLSEHDIDETQIKRSKYVYIEGYLFTADATKRAALRAINLAKTNNVKVALTVSDPFLIELVHDELWELIKGPVDLLFCNEQEAQSLTKKDDPIECAHAIHQHAENVALTLGKNGSILMHAVEAIPIESVDADAIDSTGAGDMYAAGLLFGITNGLTWKQSGRMASHAAARIVSQLGARLEHRFTSEEIKQLTV